jgi:hypothetical protein
MTRPADGVLTTNTGMKMSMTQRSNPTSSSFFLLQSSFVLCFIIQTKLSAGAKANSILVNLHSSEANF